MPTPRQGTTKRNYSRPTYGGHAAAIAAEQGTPFLPWQRYDADVALEVEPDTGLFYYSTILTTVPRQAGKTTLALSTSIQNALLTKNRRAWYTAQSGAHATEKFLEMADVWSESTLKGMAKTPRRSNGSAALELLNGSKFRPFPPTADALHGKQGDKVDVDEFWFFTIVAATILKQAIQPTMTTRRMKTGQRPQTWYWSTEGTVESTALNAMLAEARSTTPAERTAFLDWGIGPDDDPDDLDLIFATHPGAGHLFDFSDLERFREEFRDSPGEFARAFGNRRTGATERVIPKAAFEAAEWDKTPATPGRVCFGVATGVDGVDTSIVASRKYGRSGEASLTAMVDGGHQPGTWWALDKLEQLQGLYPDAWFAIDKYGPSAALYDAAERAKLNLLQLGSGDVIAATQNTVSGITNPTGPTHRYKPHPAFTSAAELASKRFTGDGTWLFGRRLSIGSISGLEAWTLGAYGVDHLPEIAGMQLG
ncbi:hypothetical protein [Cryobacterium sp. Y62]|uniref:hypothetical protein n=1 Tax=Cryobacterium sp. Y62 TaxID=2048284 RepID=UPI000CE3DAA5|nr:hypothetical protein [Cryobacterium sp. Y62]